MCTAALAAIPRDYCPAKPGNKKLYIANIGDVSAIPAVGAGTRTITTDITMVATKLFYLWEFARTACKHTENSQGNGLVEGNIEVFLSKDDDAKRAQMADMDGKHFHVLVEDGNGTIKLCEEAQFTFDFDSGQNVNDPSGFTGKFAYSEEPAKIYTGTIVTS